MPGVDTDRLREAFLEADYTVDGVQALLGPVAHEALSRGEVVPSLRATSGGSRLETLVRLFLLGAAVSEQAATQAVGPTASTGGSSPIPARPAGPTMCSAWAARRSCSRRPRSRT